MLDVLFALFGMAPFSHLVEVVGGYAFVVANFCAAVVIIDA